MKSKEFSDGLIESCKLIRQVFKNSNEKLLEVTMKCDQHNLLSYNWIKGYIDERQDKMIAYTKLESASEDSIIQQRIDANQ